MLLPLVALAAAAAATAIGGAPATGTRVERHSIYHNPHTHPAAPIPHTVEQAPRQPRRGLITEATPRGPEGPSPSAGPTATRRWQKASNARKDAPSPNPTALHPHHAEPSDAKSNCGTTAVLHIIALTTRRLVTSSF